MPPIKTMKDYVKKLKIRLSKAQHQWWEKLIREDEDVVKMWDALSTEDFHERHLIS